MARVFDSAGVLRLDEDALRAGIEVLAATVAVAPPDLVIGVARGGIRLAHALAAHLGRPVVTVRASHNHDDAVRQQATGIVDLDVTAATDLDQGLRVLLCDDICGTGPSSPAVRPVERGWWTDSDILHEPVGVGVGQIDRGDARHAEPLLGLGLRTRVPCRAVPTSSRGPSGLRCPSARPSRPCPASCRASPRTSPRPRSSRRCGVDARHTDRRQRGARRLRDGRHRRRRGAVPPPHDAVTCGYRSGMAP
jgi:hypothetical protein